MYKKTNTHNNEVIVSEENQPKVEQKKNSTLERIQNFISVLKTIFTAMIWYERYQNLIHSEEFQKIMEFVFQFLSGGSM